MTKIGSEKMKSNLLYTRKRAVTMIVRTTALNELLLPAAAAAAVHFAAVIK
jgi:hypothetical protein